MNDYYKKAADVQGITALIATADRMGLRRFEARNTGGMVMNAVMGFPNGDQLHLSEYGVTVFDKNGEELEWVLPMPELSGNDQELPESDREKIVSAAWSHIHTRYPLLADAIRLAKFEIRKDIATGQVPAHVASFGELHDYVDANTYGGLCDEYVLDDNAEWWLFGDLLQDALHCWIASGQLAEDRKTINRPL